jgi:hypothetical protein
MERLIHILSELLYDEILINFLIVSNGTDIHNRTSRTTDETACCMPITRNVPVQPETATGLSGLSLKSTQHQLPAIGRMTPYPPFTPNEW